MIPRKRKKQAVYIASFRGKSGNWGNGANLIFFINVKVGGKYDER